MLRIDYRSDCTESRTVRLTPVGRLPVHQGPWAGSFPDSGQVQGASGGLFTFEVSDRGRYVSMLRFPRFSPYLRCSDGSFGAIADLRLPSRLWVRHDGTFGAIEAIPFGRFYFTISGRFQGTTASGTLRLIQTHDDQRGACDTGVVPFTMAPTPGG